MKIWNIFLNKILNQKIIIRIIYDAFLHTI